jgi:hypothetical protein
MVVPLFFWGDNPEIDLEPEAYMTTINVPDPEWASIQLHQRRWTGDVG